MKKVAFILVLTVVLVLASAAFADTTVTLAETVSEVNGQSTISWTCDSVPQGGFIVIIEALNSR